jgi:hypothetical protein
MYIYTYIYTHIYIYMCMIIGFPVFAGTPNNWLNVEAGGLEWQMVTGLNVDPIAQRYKYMYICMYAYEFRCIFMCICLHTFVYICIHMMVTGLNVDPIAQRCRCL